MTAISAAGDIKVTVKQKPVDMPARIAVVNRGEAACRLIHAVRELNAERDPFGERPPIQTIALYTESERNAAFV